jgi:hypothetical protein
MAVCGYHRGANATTLAKFPANAATLAKFPANAATLKDPQIVAQPRR